MTLEATLVYLIIFKENADAEVRIKLFGALKTTLGLIIDNLQIYQNNQAALESILGNPLLGEFIMHVGHIIV